MSSLPVQVPQQPRQEQPQQEQQPVRTYGFQPGHPRYGGRKRGPGRLNGDLRQQIYDAAAAAGFLKVDENGNRVATGEGGCQGWLTWLYVNEPKTAAALLARVLPYFIDTSDEMPMVMSRSEVEASFREFGLPLDLIEHLQRAPAPLDIGENPDPYGVEKDKAVTSQDDVGVTAQVDVTSQNNGAK
jgi:hypothetical protein